MKVVPNLQCHTLKGDRTDPVVIDTNYLKRITTLNMLLEVIYKYVMYILMLILVIMKRDLVIDEGISLEWANYFNLMLYKKR